MCWSASIHVYHTCIRRTNVYVYVGLLVEVWTNCLFVLRSTYIFIFKNLFEEKKMWTHTRTSTPVEFEKTDRTLRGTRLLFEAIKVIITTRLRFPTISYPITPKSGPFRGMLWMSQNGIFCPKTHFPENQKSWPKALWKLVCESGSEFHKHPRMCERSEWRKQLRDSIIQSLKQTHVGSGTFSRLFWSNAITTSRRLEPLPVLNSSKIVFLGKNQATRSSDFVFHRKSSKNLEDIFYHSTFHQPVTYWILAQSMIVRMFIHH